MAADREHAGTNQARVLECPNCDGKAVQTRVVRHEFQYGTGEAAAQLHCDLPLRVCQECGSQFIDEAGEMARHEAVCRHLGLMTPSEVRAIRERYGSHADFRELSGLGIASQSRWENGACIQNRALDNFLYLLSFPDNVRRLVSRASVLVAVDPRRAVGRFRCIEITAARLQQQGSFRLCPAA